ncbi:MAG: radical SAM protein [Archaeoglobales archaeon]|nr:MAG: radical SAM protein [Archaeoglobales archaeon]
MKHVKQVKLYVANRNENCTECNFCKNFVCPSLEECIGCGACYLACPNEAVEMKEREVERHIRIKVDGETFSVPDKITVKKALEIVGYEFSKFPERGKIFAPCEVGGCWSCAVEVDGELKPSCVTPIRDGMRIETHVESYKEPKRLVHGFSGHTVGGVGTPWWLKGYGYIEAACFACGCNFRCPQCQNWTTTYCGKDLPLTPGIAAELMTKLRRAIGVDRMAISGGECTLNRKWLIQYIQELKKLNPDKEARFHVDTNASILTGDYIDELVNAGMTDIGIDVKGLKLETFQRITGLDSKLAEIYMKTEWNALKYVLDNYSSEVFVGVGIPYNRDLISMGEVREIGERIAEMDDEVQVCVLDYRPEFRSRIKRPTFQEMFEVWKVLHETGLKTVICQTVHGYIGPDGKLSL